MGVKAVCFTLQAFEGPLDLLLTLLKKNKVEIYDIPITTITQQYLEYLDEMQSFDLEVSSEFLVMAAQLLYIKSKMLLPKTKEEEEEEDPREELVRMLEEYQRFKIASDIMLERQNHSDSLFAKPPSFVEPPINDFSLKGLNMERLNAALAEVLKRKNFVANSPKEKDFTKVMERHRVSILSKAKSLIRTLGDYEQLSWFDYFDAMESKMEVVAGFLAILELLKLNKITIVSTEKERIYICKLSL